MRLLRASGVALVVLAALALATFALPVRKWRTGELPAPALPLVAGGPSVEMPARFWIDTDAACGHGRTTDPDDCLAILLLAGAVGPRLVGISTVFGNATLDTTDSITRDLAARLRPEGTTPLPVHRGSAAPAEPGRGLAPAHLALRRALGDGALTIVSLGPLTNIAVALADRPDLQGRVGRLVAVMGRRPGHLFHPRRGQGTRDPVRSRAGLQRLQLRAGPRRRGGRPGHAPADDVDPLRGRPARDPRPRRSRPPRGLGWCARAWVAGRARGWLDFWTTEVGIGGFYPFDALAAAYAIDARHLDCARASAWVGRDERLWGWLGHPHGLLVGLDHERPRRIDASGQVVYCPGADPALGEWMIGRLAALR